MILRLVVLIYQNIGFFTSIDSAEKVATLSPKIEKTNLKGNKAGSTSPRAMKQGKRCEMLFGQFGRSRDAKNTD